MLNIAMTPAAEALLQQLMQGGEGDPSLIIEQALQYFCGGSAENFSASALEADLDIDTTLGFPHLTEAEVLAENEERWKAFQENGEAYTHEQVVAHYERLMGSSEP